jgi:anti-sigma-K factor RskA
MSDLHSLAPLYAVDALSDEETREFKTHLAGCPECAREVAALHEVTARLSADAAADPPAGLRSSVLAAIATTPQDEQVPGAPGLATAVEPATEPGQPGAPVVPIRRSRPNRAISLLAAAAVLAAVGFGGWALYNRDTAQDAQAEAAALTRLLSAPDVQLVSGSSGGMSATVVMSPDRGEAMFMASGLPAPPDGKVYELWTITDEPAPAGTFTPGDTETLVALPAAAFDAQSIAVTVEPEGGSDTPTSEPVMQMDMG